MPRHVEAVYLLYTPTEVRAGYMDRRLYVARGMNRWETQRRLRLRIRCRTSAETAPLPKPLINWVLPRQGRIYVLAAMIDLFLTEPLARWTLRHRHQCNGHRGQMLGLALLNS